MHRKKPREFWLTNPDDGYNGIYDKKPYFQYEHQFHVIEKWAYESVKNKLEIAIDALKHECANNCAEENPCAAKMALRIIEQI